jgi:hypothetical protein
MKNSRTFKMDLNLYNEIDSMICDFYGYIDEFVYSDLLFVVKYGLGLTENYKPDDYMYDVFDKLDITEGKFHDDELTRRIKKAEKAIGTYDEWQDMEVAILIKDYLKNK